MGAAGNAKGVTTDALWLWRRLDGSSFYSPFSYGYLCFLFQLAQQTLGLGQTLRPLRLAVPPRLIIHAIGGLLRAINGD